MFSSLETKSPFEVVFSVSRIVDAAKSSKASITKSIKILSDTARISLRLAYETMDTIITASRETPVILETATQNLACFSSSNEEIVFSVSLYEAVTIALADGGKGGGGDGCGGREGEGGGRGGGDGGDGVGGDGGGRDGGRCGGDGVGGREGGGDGSGGGKGAIQVILIAVQVFAWFVVEHEYLLLNSVAR